MNCDEASEWFSVYQELSESSSERLAVDHHMASCSSCAEQFRWWNESAELIGQLTLLDEAEAEAAGDWSADSLSRDVMSRIYTEQSWYMPAVRKTYAFTQGFRLKIAVLLAGLFAVFGCAFLYTAWNRLSGGEHQSVGVMETANAFAIGGSVDAQTVVVPVASLSDPIVLHVSPSMPEYWVALSLLGMIMMLLILNWFSRVRS